MHLSLTTPRGSVIDTEVEEITAPGALGEFGVLPGHIPFLSALRPGVFVYRTKDGSRAFAVGEGILEVARAPGTDRDKLLVLVEDAAAAKDIDREAAAKELAAVDAEIATWKKDAPAEYRALMVRRAWAAARVAAADRH